MVVNKKLLMGFKKVKKSEGSEVLGGMTFNDNYNKKTFGITKVEYREMSDKLYENHGMFPPYYTELKIKDFK